MTQETFTDLRQELKKRNVSLDNITDGLLPCGCDGVSVPRDHPIAKRILKELEKEHYSGEEFYSYLEQKYIFNRAYVNQVVKEMRMELTKFQDSLEKTREKNKLSEN